MQVDTGYKSRCRGFTLLELLMVITIFGILATLALPAYHNSVIKAKEAILKEDLFLMRDVLDKFRADKDVYPNSLNELVEEGYIRAIPVDPFTRSADTWLEEYSFDNDEESSGIYDLKSGSDLIGSDGVPYSEW